MKSIIFSLSLVLSLCFISCSKEDYKTTNDEKLISGVWHFDHFSTADSLITLDSCFYDNTIDFLVDNKVDLSEGEDICFLADSTTSSMWYYSYAIKELVIIHNGEETVTKVLELTDSKLVMESSDIMSVTYKK